MNRNQRLWEQSRKEAALKSVVERKGRPLTKRELDAYKMPPRIRPPKPGRL